MQSINDSEYIIIAAYSNIMKQFNLLQGDYLKGGMEVNICAMNYFMPVTQMAKRSPILQAEEE